MLEDGRIDGRQAVYLNVTYIVATALLGIPAISAAQAKQDAWMSSLLATILSLAIAWLTVKLGSLFPGKTLIEYQPEILGRWLGKVLAFLYVAFFIHICALMVREFGDFLMEAFFQRTPILVFHLVVVAIGAYTVREGLEVLARVNQTFLPLILFSVIIIILLGIPEMSFKRLLPVFDTGLVPIFKGSLSPLAWQGEIIALGMIMPFLIRPEEAGKTAVKGLIIVGLALVTVIAGSLATFGPLTGSMAFPFLNTSRIINVAKFLDRVEPLVMVIWVAGGFIKISFFYYISVLAGAQCLKLKDYRPLILPVGLILVSLSMAVGENSLQISHFLAHIWPFYGLTFEVAIPTILFTITLLKGTGGKRR